MLPSQPLKSAAPGARAVAAAVLERRRSLALSPSSLSLSPSLWNFHSNRMFYSAEDINWFKPVQVITKYGLTGHIRESLGTHGKMKCLFNRPLAQHDTVMMNLYRRVYPRYIEGALIGA